jgi:hypothetical protein
VETTYSSTAGELIAALLDKTGGQIHGANIFPEPGGEGQKKELKKPFWGRSN